MPGQLIDVGGRILHLHCTGSGSPTVLLQPGMGEMSSNLAWIAPAVSRHTRVCVYDRAGRGWSQPADRPQDAGQIASDLHSLLGRADVKGPYVLAGHSFGGLYSLTFAARYPDEVAGMVLLDSTAPASTTAPDGSDSGAAVMASGRRAAELDDFGDKPLVVLTAGATDITGWGASQAHLADLSTDSAHRIVADASHESLVGDQTNAVFSVTAIRDVVAAVRSGRALRR